MRGRPFVVCAVFAVFCEPLELLLVEFPLLLCELPPDPWLVLLELCELLLLLLDEVGLLLVWLALGGGVASMMTCTRLDVPPSS